MPMSGPMSRRLGGDMLKVRVARVLYIYGFLSAYSVLVYAYKTYFWYDLGHSSTTGAMLYLVPVVLAVAAAIRWTITGSFARRLHLLYPLVVVVMAPLALPTLVTGDESAFLDVLRMLPTHPLSIGFFNYGVVVQALMGVLLIVPALLARLVGIPIDLATHRDFLYFAAHFIMICIGALIPFGVYHLARRAGGNTRAGIVAFLIALANLQFLEYSRVALPHLVAGGCAVVFFLLLSYYEETRRDRVLTVYIPAALGISLNVYLTTFVLPAVFAWYVVANRRAVGTRMVVKMAGVFAAAFLVSNPLFVVNRFLPGYEGRLEHLLTIMAANSGRIHLDEVREALVGVINGMSLPVAALSIMAVAVVMTRLVKGVRPGLLDYMVTYGVVDAALKFILSGAESRFLLASLPVLIASCAVVLLGERESGARSSATMDRGCLAGGVLVLAVAGAYCQRQLAGGGLQLPHRHAFLLRQCAILLPFGALTIAACYVLLRKGRVRAVAYIATAVALVSAGAYYTSLLRGTNQYRVARYALRCCGSNTVFLSRFPSYARHWRHSEDSLFTRVSVDTLQVDSVEHVIVTSNYVNRFLLAPPSKTWHSEGLTRRNEYYLSFYATLFYGEKFSVELECMPPFGVIDGCGFHNSFPYEYVISRRDT